MTEEKAIKEYQSTDWLAPVTTVSNMLAAYTQMKEFVTEALREELDFGVIPGTKKRTLLKPGAEKLGKFWGLKPSFDDVEIIQDWTGKEHDGEPFFYYRQRCNLYRGNVKVADAEGSANSWEKKYRWRQAERTCPNCNKATIIKGKEEYGGGWLCWKKKGGCGSKFNDGDKTIEGQQLDPIKNPDIHDTPNTILKMAQKRAFVAATLLATNASDYFTQDMEDVSFGNGSDVIPGQFKEAKEVKREPYTHPPAQQEAQPAQDAVLVKSEVHVTPNPEQVDADDPVQPYKRPYTPEQLRERLAGLAAKFDNFKPTDAQVGLLRYALTELFVGDDNHEDKRHTVLAYLSGSGSTKDTGGSMWKAIVEKWCNFTKRDDGSNEYFVNDSYAVEEAQSIIKQALIDEGQTELAI